MTSRTSSTLRFIGPLAAALVLSVTPAAAAEPRDQISYLRGPYNTAFFYRENEAFRIGAAIHFAHGKQHDVLELTPLERHEQVDAETAAEFEEFTRGLEARTEPTMEYYAPYTARMAWRVFRAIDWTHMHHEQTYDILAESGIPWAAKDEWTDRAVRYYLEKNEVAFSCAPLDVTMRRVAAMSKPYFTYFRNYYPRSNNFFYGAHWWHPAIYQAQMRGGNGVQQERLVSETDRTYFERVLASPPLRMLLSREVMPLYARMSPESANIFDNLHMFHGIVYDIMAYERWTPEQKRAELYRVIDAMRYRPGDEALARKFTIPHADVDPRVYAEWMRGVDGEMNRIMMEMHEEMMPLMVPEGRPMAPEMRRRMMEQMKKKLAPGMQAGESAGSLHDAMMELMPDMKMAREAMEPGATPHKMVDAMLRGWTEKYGSMADVQPVAMSGEGRL